MSEVRKEEREIHNSAKIDVMAPAKLHPLPKNEKTRWKIFAQRKNPAQKNPREISGLNNRAENSHLPFRRREYAMQGFRKEETLQKFTSIHSQIYNHFNEELGVANITVRIVMERSKWNIGYPLHKLKWVD